MNILPLLGKDTETPKGKASLLERRGAEPPLVLPTQELIPAQHEAQGSLAAPSARAPSACCCCGIQPSEAPLFCTSPPAGHPAPMDM